MTTTTTTLAARLDQARRRGRAIPQLTAAAPLDLDEAYAVQRAGVRLRTDAGERVAGVKLGFTSTAKARQMGVEDVILGVLTDAMEIADGGVVDLSHGVHPRIEPEVAFRLNREIDPQDPGTDVRGAVGAVAAALEVIDSRYRDFTFSLADVVADNTSASAFAVGPWTPVAPGTDLVLADRPVELAVDGEAAATGSTTAILGDPWQALPAVLRMSARYGRTLPAGTVLLAGAATAAVALRPDTTVTARVAGLGDVSLSTTGGTDA